MKKSDFDKIRNAELAKFREAMTERIQKHRFQGRFVKEQLGQINSELSEIHNSDPELNVIFFELYNVWETDRSLILIDLCEEYCLANKIDSKRAITFFPKLIFLYDARKWLINFLGTQYEEVVEKINDEAEEAKHTEFTLARRILAIQFLTKMAGSEIDFGRNGVNKIKIAEFVDFLTSKEGNRKVMRDTWEYTKVKKLWDNEKEANINDLIYIRDEFINISLTNVADKIELLIKQRE